MKHAAFAKILKEGGSLLFIRITNVLAGFLIVAVFARMLGASIYGNYVFILAVCTNLTLALHLGMPTLLTREIAAALATRHFAKAQWLEGWSLKVILAAALVLAAAAGLALIGAASRGLWPGIPHFPIIAALSGGIVLMLALQQRAIGVLSGRGRVVAAQLPDGVIRPVVLLLAGISALALWPRSLTAILGGFLMAAAVSVAVGWLFLWRLRPYDAHAAAMAVASHEAGRVWLRRILPFLTIGIVVTLNNTVDVLLLSAFLPSAEVGRYKVAALLAAIPLNLHTVSQNMLMPRAAAAWAVGDLDGLARLARSASRVSFGVVLCYAVVFALTQAHLVHGLFGEDFRGAGGLTFLLLLSASFVTFSASAPTLLNMCGQAELNSRIAATSLAVNVAGGLVMIPYVGPAGAALASICASGFSGFVSWKAVRDRLGVRCDVLAGRWPGLRYSAQT